MFVAWKLDFVLNRASIGYNETSEFRISDYEIMQYTGLNDKSGNEIYEGDIVVENHDGREGESNIGMIFFAAGTFMIDGDGPLYDHTYSHSPDILEDYLVVGNRYENPELLTIE